MKIRKKKKHNEFYGSISINEVKQYINELLEVGFIEINGYTEKGEPRYSITTIGRMELELE